MTINVSDWDFNNPFSKTLSVNKSDIDGLGHVNNGVYVNWCQDVGWQHSIELGLNLDDYHRMDAAMVIRHAEYDYIAAAFLGERCEMATWLTANDGRLTMERRFQLRRCSDGATLLRARWQLVCIKLSNGKPRRMPPAFNTQYDPAVIDIET